MKRILTTAAFGLWAYAAFAQFESPFRVAGTLERQDGGKALLAVSLEMPAKHYVYAEHFSVTAEGDVPLREHRVPAPVLKHDSFTDTEVSVYEGSQRFEYALAGVPPGPLAVRVSYQGCSDSICFLPATEKLVLTPDGTAPVGPAAAAGPPAPTPAANGGATDGFTLTGRAQGYLDVDTFTGFLDDAEAGRGMQPDKLRSLFETHGIWLVIPAIILFGLALNLTPCVLPMIPINIAIIGAGTQAASRGRGFARGAAFGAGMALVYGVLGLLVVLAGSKFGAIQSSPWFNLAIAVVFVALALAMFGVFNLDLSRFQSGIGVGKPGNAGAVTALVLGGLMALLAGACVAPPVISTLLLSAELYNGGNAVGMLLPLLLGVGMALPWPFAAAGLSFLPRPGRWMEFVKYGFGVVILGFAARYAWLGAAPLLERIGLDTDAVIAAQAKAAGEGWLTSLEQGMAQAARERKPLFVDCWAKTCKACLKMDKTTFKDPVVKQRLERYVRVKYRAEPLTDPRVAATLDSFGASGLPAFVILAPNE